MEFRQIWSHCCFDNVIFVVFQSRLQFFALAVQGYIKKLKEFIASKTKTELATEENQLKLVALR